MKFARRDVLYLSGIAAAVPGVSRISLAQVAPAAPKLVPAAPRLTQLLRTDLEGQDQIVQETVVSAVEFAPGSAAPWHAHPSAQELLYVIEGILTIEVEGRGTKVVKTGEIGVIPADVVHLARNESAGVSAKALVVHSRGAKDKPLVVVAKR